VRALITNMNAPLGRTIGNALEIKETIAILHGRGPKDATQLTQTLGAHMLVMGGRAESLAHAHQQLDDALQDGRAWQKFRQMVAAQGGDVRTIDEPHLLPMARHQTVLRAHVGGYIERLDAYELGHAAMLMGAGRSCKTDTIDAAVGIELHGTVGDAVRGGEPLLTLHHNAPVPLGLVQRLHDAAVVADAPRPLQPMILDVLGD
jgi:pyrimidine-nucleoside phosphorylase